MAGEIFLARTEEQEKFKQVLHSHHKNLWQILQTPLFNKPVENDLPFVLLFYGEGGMGKTRLIHRLRQIAEEEKPYADKFNTLFLDWEDKQNHNLGLQVGHDNISPETVLQVLHDAFVAKNWGSYFGEYRKLMENLKAIEAKVDQDLKSRPDKEIETHIRKLGAKGIAWIVRQAPGADVLPSQSLEPVFEKAIQVGAEGLYQARQFVQKVLTPKEYEIYAQPYERLAEALGKGIAELAKRKPLVVFLDTYEIVDRPECDYSLRSAIQQSGKQVVWVIAGRANLADSGQRGSLYFRGYKRDFPEDQIYAKPLSEFGLTEIQEYFIQLVPERCLTTEEVEALARFSLGIPFIISQAAAMWKEGKPLSEIVAPVQTVLGVTTSREQVVKVTSERFLMHCFSAKERERDLQAVYALAMMRRPNVELLKAMLDVTDLERELQSLRERYSFIWVEQVRLDEKLAQFLREYLLAPVRRDDSMVQQLNERAIAWLELRLESLTQDISDTAERLQDERITETIADLAHHYFWQEEEKGWLYLVPRFVEGWQYDRACTRSLLEVAEAFRLTFGKDGQRRLKLFFKALESLPNLDNSHRILEELEKLADRKWLDGEGAEERKAILQLQRGELLYFCGKYKEALQVYLEIEKQVPAHTVQLRKDLTEALQEVAWEVDWENGITAYQQAIELNPQSTYLYNGLGDMYYAKGNYSEAIAAYQEAITLDPNYAYPYNGLGDVYAYQGKCDEAIAAYKCAISLDPKCASAYNGLGWSYLMRNDLIQAKAQFEAAIPLDPKRYYYPVFNLGLVYALEGKVDEAHSQWQKSLAICQGGSAWDRAFRSLYTVAVGESKGGIAEMRKIIHEDRSALGVLQEMLGDAEILARCPVKPEGIDTVIDVLKQAIG